MEVKAFPIQEGVAVNFYLLSLCSENFHGRDWRAPSVTRIYIYESHL